MDEATAAAPAYLEKRGGVGVVWLNRPEVRNAVDAALSRAAGSALAEADADPGIRVIVVAGVGDVFCAGADLKALARGERIDDAEHAEWGFAGIVRHWVTKPTIAAVNGAALGGGTEIMMACDLAVADEAAVFGLPEVRHGIFAAAGGVMRLPRQVPPRIALEVILTGQPISAEQAAHWGLINRVAPRGRALEIALGVADLIAANAPVAVRESKRLAHESLQAGSEWNEDLWALNTAAIRTVFRSADALEGPRAFAEGREPEWSGS